MGFELSVQLKLEQKLILTQQMQLSIKLLQMSNVDLVEYIEKEFSENPILESQYDNVEDNSSFKNRLDYKELIKYLEFDNYSSNSYLEYEESEKVSPLTFAANSRSLKEYLHEQVMELSIDKLKKSVCDYIIESLNTSGYLDIPIEDISSEINIGIELGKEALAIVQDLEPSGIGARKLEECLSIQVKRKGIEDNNLNEIINNHLEDIAENKYNSIARSLGISVQQAQSYGDVIKKLEPKPSRGFYTGEATKYILPDAEIRKIDGIYYVLMNDGVLPKLSINSVYKEILTNSSDKEAESYIKEKINSAMQLIKGIDQRKTTLQRLLEKIVEKQQEYFDKGKEYLKPMTMKEIAVELNYHESTVSRAVKEKYVLTSLGMIKIKDLFTAAISSLDTDEEVAVAKIKNKISELINNEDKKKPISDQVICDILNSLSMNISRRTVAKYREEMGLKSSAKRKRF